MDLFIEKIPSALITETAPKKTAKSEKCVKKLFKMLIASSKKAEKLVDPKIVVIDDSERLVKKAIEKYIDGGNYYFPKRMINTIEMMAKYSKIVDINLEIGKRTIRLFFVVREKSFSKFMEDLPKYLSHLKTWFCFLDEIAPEACAETLTIKIFLTDEKKELPSMRGDIIGVDNVNSAFSDVCKKNGEIIIYRQEEWFKILIHECLHNYGLDFSLMDQSVMASDLFKVFPLGMNIGDALLSETYTETWAEILNLAFISIDLLRDKYSVADWNTFSLYFHFLIQIELIHSLAQTQKILYHYDLSYEDLLERKSACKYKQNSHVFEYYVLKSVLLSNYPDFLCWADENLKNLIAFPNGNEKTLMSFCEELKKGLANGFIERIVLLSDVDREKGLRMSICEL
jgi:hypothetical protein